MKPRMYITNINDSGSVGQGRGTADQTTYDDDDDDKELMGCVGGIMFGLVLCIIHATNTITSSRFFSSSSSAILTETLLLIPIIKCYLLPVVEPTN